MTERERVHEHIKVLSILYFVNAALHALGMCIGGVWVAMGGFVAAAVQNAPDRPEGADAIGTMMGGMFALIGGFVVCAALAGAICSFLCARFMAAKTHPTFSLVVAALTCLNVPLGTLLGVFTFIVLGKPEAKAMYEEVAAGLPGAQLGGGSSAA